MSVNNVKESEKEETIANEEITDASEAVKEPAGEEVVQQPEKKEVSEEEQQQESDEYVDIISKLEKELAEAKDSLLRKAAELDNVRKRVQRERVILFEEAKVSALEEFLPISDDMNRVLDAANELEIDDSFLSGIKMVVGKFEEVLSKYGVERINQVGVPFDVNLHDAMLRQPAPDKKTPSDTILMVIENGYKIGNRVIKHAKVIVSE